MATVGTLLMSVDADTKKFEKGISRSQKAFKGMTKAIKVGAVAASAAIVAIGAKSIKLAQEQEKAEARLEAIAKKVTKATDDQVQSLKDLAAAQQKVSTFGDEVLIAGQSQLLSFGLQADQAGELTESLANLLAATKGMEATQEDAIGAANLLGKAFSGQAGALSKAGILLDETQAGILKNGTAAEKTAALVEIMNQNYGGLAETMAQTSEGQMIQVKNAIGDIGEVIGNIFIPMVAEATSFVASKLPEIQKVAETVFGFIGDTVTNFTKLFRGEMDLGDVFNRMSDWLSEGESKFSQFTGIAIGVVGDLLKFLQPTFDTIKNIAIDVFNKIVEFAGIMSDFIVTNVIPIFEQMVAWVVENMPTFKNIFEEVFSRAKDVAMTLYNFFVENLLPIYQKLLDWVIANMPQIKQFIVDAFEGALKVFDVVWKFIKDNVLPIIEALYKLVEDVFPIIWKVVKASFGAILELTKTLWGFFERNLLPIIKTIFDVVADVIPKLAPIFKGAFEIIGNVIDGVIGTIKSFIDFVDTAIQKAKEFFSVEGSVPSEKTVSGRTKSSTAPRVRGNRANGGPVMGGSSYLVGEKGPEMFTPSTSGTISSGTGASVTININGTQDPNLIMNKVVDILNRQGITRR